MKKHTTAPKQAQHAGEKRTGDLGTPSTQELVQATIALAQAKGRKHEHDWHALSLEALTIWKQCQKTIQQDAEDQSQTAHRQQQAIRRQQEESELLKKIKFPKSYPITGREFFKLAKGKGKSDECQKCFKQFLLYTDNFTTSIQAGFEAIKNGDEGKLSASLLRNPLDVDTIETDLQRGADLLSRFKSLSLDEQQFRLFALAFAKFRAKKPKIMRGRKGGKAKAAKAEAARKAEAKQSSDRITP